MFFVSEDRGVDFLSLILAIVTIVMHNNNFVLNPNTQIEICPPQFHVASLLVFCLCVFTQRKKVPSPTAGKPGQPTLTYVESPIHVTNVAPVDPVTKWAILY